MPLWGACSRGFEDIAKATYVPSGFKRRAETLERLVTALGAYRRRYLVFRVSFGVRPSTRQHLFPQFRNTTFYFSASEFPNIQGLVALTIDDGICRGGHAKTGTGTKPTDEKSRDGLLEMNGFQEKGGEPCSCVCCIDSSWPFAI